MSCHPWKQGCRDTRGLPSRKREGTVVARAAALATVLRNFRSQLPAYVSEQSDTIRWLAAAHTRAEQTLALSRGDTTFSADDFRRRLERHLERFGCGADKIARRGHEIADFCHERFSEMEVYGVADLPSGAGMLERTRVFAEKAHGVLLRLYSEHPRAPTDLVHVTCTGYVSPSPAQRLVVDKGWHDRTRVTHAYHMGCYAAIPALRIAEGFVAARGVRGASPAQVEIAHTELCSLHLDPLLHTPEQLVVQTLFADGYIAYSVADDQATDARGAGLSILALEEALIPDSSASMGWICADGGMRMTLARDVPEKIADSIEAFVVRLSESAGISAEARRRAIYAVHPGGPRILDLVRDTLKLEEAQIASSRKVLRERGNMSSATLPHVWMELCRSPALPPDGLVVSLAFGPGLTVCGAVMRKIAR